MAPLSGCFVPMTPCVSPSLDLSPGVVHWLLAQFPSFDVSSGVVRWFSDQFCHPLLVLTVRSSSDTIFSVILPCHTSLHRSYQFSEIFISLILLLILVLCSPDLHFAPTHISCSIPLCHPLPRFSTRSSLTPCCFPWSVTSSFRSLCLLTLLPFSSIAVFLCYIVPIHGPVFTWSVPSSGHLHLQGNSGSAHCLSTAGVQPSLCRNGTSYCPITCISYFLMVHVYVSVYVA